MSVATRLGLDGPDNPVLIRAALDWDTWVVWDSRLAAVTGGVEGLRQWLRRADPAAADDVLHGLAGLGSPSGGDSLLAARVLAWALLPGASALARRLASLTPDIDAIVAAQLWLEIRSFPWRRLRKVAANILANTRVGVLRECGVASQLHRVDRVWAQSRLVDPQAAVWADLEAAPSRTAAEELSAVLDWACDRQVIDGRERALLLALVAAAVDADVRHLGRGRAGLLANSISETVAEECGVSPITVRRRARRAVQALATAFANHHVAA